jgi:hypothetical protein
MGEQALVGEASELRLAFAALGIFPNQFVSNTDRRAEPRLVQRLPRQLVCCPKPSQTWRPDRSVVANDGIGSARDAASTNEGSKIIASAAKPT